VGVGVEKCRPVASGKSPAGAIVELKSRLKRLRQSHRLEVTNPPNASLGGGTYDRDDKWVSSRGVGDCSHLYARTMEEAKVNLKK